MKEIKLKRDGAFSVMCGVIVAGDTDAYVLKIDMEEPTEGFSAMAICQENGNYSTDFAVSGTWISCRLVNSMYSDEGFITVRLAVSKGNSVLTAKEAVFHVVAPNNDSVLAENESGNITEILTAVSKMENASKGFAKKADTISGYGITDAYTKNEIDSLVSRVYKYKGSVASSIFLPVYDAGKNVGDVYNISDGATYDSKAIATAGMLYSISSETIDDVKRYIVEVNGYDTSLMGQTIDVGLEVIVPDEYGGGTTFIAGTKYGTRGGGTTVIITPIRDYNSEHGWEIYEGNFDMLSGMIKSYGSPFTIKNWYFSGIGSKKYNSGVNVAWNGTGWDTLGTTVDLSSMASKTDVDEKIAASVTSALNTEV